MRKKNPITQINCAGFTIIELLVAVTILGFLVAASISVINFRQDAVRQTASKITSDMSSIEMAFTNYSISRNAFPTGLTDPTFVGGVFLFVPTPPDGFTPYTMSSNADGFFICTSATVSGTADFRYQSILRVQSNSPQGKSFRNTICPAITNVDPATFPATLHFTWWIFRR
jgi:prepilin-type N-terminal cleavage/methylation domain-containing protein